MLHIMRDIVLSINGTHSEIVIFHVERIICDTVILSIGRYSIELFSNDTVFIISVNIAHVITPFVNLFRQLIYEKHYSENHY